MNSTMSLSRKDGDFSSATNVVCTFAWCKIGGHPLNLFITPNGYRESPAGMQPEFFGATHPLSQNRWHPRGCHPLGGMAFEAPKPGLSRHMQPGPGLYRRFLLYKPGVGQNIALHAAPADRTFTYLVCAFPIHWTSFPPPPHISPAIITMKHDKNSDSKFCLY